MRPKKPYVLQNDLNMRQRFSPPSQSNQKADALSTQPRAMTFLYPNQSSSELGFGLGTKKPDSRQAFLLLVTPLGFEPKTS